VLLAKIFYDTDEEESLLSLLASFTIFLKRNKNISNNLKHTYLNFCQILIQILKKQETKIQKISSQIQETKLLTDRKWLLQILND
jgi:16S rRNA A1518/A1519 N6-dimethyltransferase RsmA/KsgA/DIM1 with predicted DNA glycosylase/AP lyase activity